MTTRFRETGGIISEPKYIFPFKTVVCPGGSHRGDKPRGSLGRTRTSSIPHSALRIPHSAFRTSSHFAAAAVRPPGQAHAPLHAHDAAGHVVAVVAEDE